MYMSVHVCVYMCDVMKKIHLEISKKVHITPKCYEKNTVDAFQAHSIIPVRASVIVCARVRE